MKSTTLISLVVAILVGLWMGIGIMNAGAGLVFGVVTFVVVRGLLWFIGPLQPKDVPLRKKKPSVSIKGEDKASPGIDAVASSIEAYDVETDNKGRLVSMKTRDIGIAKDSPHAGRAEDYIDTIPGDFSETMSITTDKGEYTHTFKPGETDFTWLDETEWTLDIKAQVLRKYAEEGVQPILNIPGDVDDEELEKVMKLTGLSLHPGDTFAICHDGSYIIVERADL